MNGPTPGPVGEHAGRLIVLPPPPPKSTVSIALIPLAVSGLATWCPITGQAAAAPRRDGRL